MTFLMPLHRSRLATHSAPCDHCIVLVLVDTGIRAEEICNI